MCPKGRMIQAGRRPITARNFPRGIVVSYFSARASNGRAGARVFSHRCRSTTARSSARRHRPMRTRPPHARGTNTTKSYRADRSHPTPPSCRTNSTCCPVSSFMVARTGARQRPRSQQKRPDPFWPSRRQGIQEVPGTTRRHANVLRLPCRRHRPSQNMAHAMLGSGFYSGPTPRLQRLTPARPKAGTGDQAGP